MSRPTPTTPRSPLLTLIGALVCKWKGGHKWVRRRTQYADMLDKCVPSDVEIFASAAKVTHYVSVCTRCGTTRPIKTRAKRVKTEAAQ